MALRFYVAVYKNGKPIKDDDGDWVVAPEGEPSKAWVFAVARDYGGKVAVLEEVARISEAK